MAIPRHLAHHVYGIIAHPTMTAEQKAMALKGLADANTQAQTIRSAYVMPPLGGVGDTHLRPDIAPKVPQGAARPYAPGEYTMNPDQSWSSERSMTVQNPDGSWAVVPSLWLKDGHPYEASGEDEAMRLARESKLAFKKFKSLPEADKFSIDREAQWQPIQNPADADKIAPLWDPTPSSVAPPKATPQAVTAAGTGTAGSIASPVVQYPQASMSFPPLGSTPSASFSSLPPPVAQSSAPGDEIDRQRMLALAALSKPTDYPVLR